MSKKYLISEKGNWYKANLHCHTTVSDGKLTPEQIKEEYKKRGYSIVAFSDHFSLTPHIDLKDKDFLPITAMEPGIGKEETPYWTQTYHLNFYSKKENRDTFFDFEKIYSVDNINSVIEKANAEGFLVQYNHPRWSQQESEMFVNLKGLWGFEIFNTSCDMGFANGYGDEEYIQLLRRDLTVVPSANDDNHNARQLDDPLSDSFGGFTMIKAENLEYDTVLSAMEKREVYASTGPIIKELYVENGEIHVITEPCSAVILFAQKRYHKAVRSHTDSLTHTVFEINDDYAYVRFEVIDSKRNKAMTRVYLKSEL